MVEIRVWIGPPMEEAIKIGGDKFPEPVSAKAMIDTGATVSVIEPEISK